MAFGFSNYGKTRTSSLSGGAKAKSTPKSVQDIIDRATAAATGAGMPLSSGPAMFQTPGAATAMVPYAPAVTPASQSTIVSGSPATGAGFAAAAPSGYAGSAGVVPAGTAAATPANVPGNLNPATSDAYTGFMSRFNPAAFQDQVYNDPQVVLNAMWNDLGLNTSSPLYTTLRSLNNADPLSLYLLNNPGATAGSLNAENYGNFLHNLYGSQMTPGGRTIDFNEALNAMKGVGNQSGLAPDQQSALYQQLSQGGPAQQFRTYYGLAQDAAKMSLPPAIAAAFLDALARQGDTYLAGSAQAQGGNVSPFFQYSSNPMG